MVEGEEEEEEKLRKERRKVGGGGGGKEWSPRPSRSPPRAAGDLSPSPPPGKNSARLQLPHLHLGGRDEEEGRGMVMRM